MRSYDLHIFGNFICGVVPALQHTFYLLDLFPFFIFLINVIIQKNFNSRRRVKLELPWAKYSTSSKTNPQNVSIFKVHGCPYNQGNASVQASDWPAVCIASRWLLRKYQCQCCKCKLRRILSECLLLE